MKFNVRQSVGLKQFFLNLWLKNRNLLLTLFGIIFILLLLVVLIFTAIAKPDSNRNTPDPFPIGVDPSNKKITVNNFVDTYFRRYADRGAPASSEESGLFQALRYQYHSLANSHWQNFLAAPLSKRLVINSGERKEEVADNFALILDWTDEGRDLFLELVADEDPVITDGKFFPGWYFVDQGASPETVADLVNTIFYEEVVLRYPEEIEARVPLRQALIVASLLEREAYKFEDMRNISGVIWKRLFIGMNLQLDATLQYAKGSSPSGPWWPVPVPQDKYIDSPYNTYQNSGLPPAPIANPNLDAILAALNPNPTDCLFYFHDDYGEFHCSESYEGHVQKLRSIYGQGR